MENLRLVFPNKSEKERLDLARKSYYYQTMSVLELGWAPRHLTIKSAPELVKYSFEDKADFEAARNGPAIWVTPHYGTFEWLSIHWALTEPNAQPMIVAEDFRNPGLTPLFKKMREYSGCQTIPQERAMVRLLRHLHKGGQAAFLSDLRVPPSKASTVIDCFGLKTSVTILHAFLAKQTKAPIIPVICFPQPDHTYVFHAYKRIEVNEDATPHSIAQSCWDAFEPELRKNPEPWMWMYKQWRYLPEESASGYPAYAHYSEYFADLNRKIQDAIE